MAKALVRINAARSDYEEDAEEFEQHLGFALGGPAAMDVAEPGDETGELPQVSALLWGPCKKRSAENLPGVLVLAEDCKL